MRKTLRWIFASAVFLAAAVFLFAHVSETLRRKSGGLSDMVHMFYGIEDNTLDVVCMGSSHGYSSFQPNILWGEYGVTSCLMCSPRQTAATTYYLLREVLNHQKPRVLLLESYYFFYNKKYADEGALRLCFDGVPMGPVKCEMIEDFMGDSGLKNKLTYYIPFLKYHGRWDSLKEQDFQSEPYLKGSIMDFEVYPMDEPELPQKGRKLPQSVQEYLEKIIALCEENGISLVLYTAPYGYEEGGQEKYLRKQMINLTLEKYLEERGIPYLDMQRSNPAGIDYSSDFRDYSHLNTNGAVRITRYLSRFLTENYDLPDHRQDEAYASWNEDYEKFLQDGREGGLR